MFNPDFKLNFNLNRNIKILQFTDPQVIESEQQRTPDRLSLTQYNQWKRVTREQNLLRYVRSAIEMAKPDFIMISGDFVYGQFDDNGTVLSDMTEFWDSFSIPWTTVMGNHERDTVLGDDYICNTLSSAKNILFKKGNFSGCGNFSIEFINNSVSERLLIFLDSFPIDKHISEFKEDQTEWLFNLCKEYKAKNPNKGISLIYHSQMAIVGKALEQYGYPNTGFFIENSKTDFGYVGAKLKSAWDYDYKLFYKLKDAGVDSHFFGHEHCNFASVVFEGVRLHYGLKSSTYDRCCYLNNDGTVFSGYDVSNKPFVGASFIEINGENGKLEKCEYIFC